MRDDIYTVSQINTYIKNMFIREYTLNHIYLKGEVSNCKYHSSGHIYFTLKDKTSQMSCVMFAGQRKGLTFRMEQGQSVIVLGSIQVYERDGKYQMYAREILLDGIGLLYERFEALKSRLQAEGLFDEQHKKTIPFYSSYVGIVTSQTGAAIQDIMQIAARRNPYAQLVLCPAQVQGEGAAEEIAKSIRMLDEYGVDVIIVGRGGGSIEDLWPFNEEVVARAVYVCETPVISAVGHETDTTIVDYVSDLRAPTPSAAAELAVCDVEQLLEYLAETQGRLIWRMEQKIRYSRQQIEHLSVRLKHAGPFYQMQQNRQYIADTEEKLKHIMKQKLTQKRQRLMLYTEALRRLSPLDKLQKGYAFLTDADGDMVNSVQQVNTGDVLRVNVTDGILDVVVQNINQNHGQE